MTHSFAEGFEWDDEKNSSNQLKHGVSFEEASELFTSVAHHLEIFDVAHSETEERFISIGPIKRGVVFVVWTARDDDVIRIISARWATANERRMYLEHLVTHE